MQRSRTSASGALLGFGLGGLFDGILLHQVLGWHHLLSLVERDGDRLSLRDQLLADGLFHVAMYAVVAVALVALWRTGPITRDRALANWTLIGFGVWNVVDIVGFHWVLGIHRVRVDVAEPLPWDVGWLALFGVMPLVLGVARRAPPASGLTLTVLTMVMTLVSLQPARTGDAPVTVVFAPGVSAGAAFTALVSAGGYPVTADRSGSVWAAALPEGTDRRALRRAGALLIGGGRVGSGCAAWSAPGPSR